jgi:Tol biopolymer transport system component
VTTADAAIAMRNSTERVSVDSAGNQANKGSPAGSAISAHGRYVAFWSYADNLVPGDTNGRDDVFVHDRKTGITTRVSVDSAGNQGNGGSFDPAISADGRYVAFASEANNPVPDSPIVDSDIFVHDRKTGITTMVSVDSAGNQASYGGNYDPAISAHGRYVAFTSYADNLVPADTNGGSDAFVHDRKTGITTRVSVDSAGNQADNGRIYDLSYGPAISADGRYVAFNSHADNLVPADTNGGSDVFVHDRKSGITTRVSVDSTGAQAGYHSFSPAISADGHSVTFYSRATNLVADDTNNQPDIFVHDRRRRPCRE